MKHLFKSALLVLAVSATAAECAAQNIITFDNSSSNRSRSRRRNTQTDIAKNSVSVGLLSWFNGYTGIYYERGISDVLALQVGLGVTSRSFGADLGNIFNEEGTNSDNFRNSDRDITDEYYNYKYRKTVPGLYASFAPKVYYQAEGMDGAYVAPMIEFKQYRYNARIADASQPVGNNGYSYEEYSNIPRSSATFQESMRCIDLTLNFGGHWQTGNHLVFGFATGLGVRNSKSQRLDMGLRAVGTSSSGTDYVYANAVNEFDKTKLIFTFNFFIGGCF